MASFTITGTITKIEDRKKIGESFYVRNFMVKESSEQFPQEYPFQFTGDKVGVLDHYTTGVVVTVSFNIDVKEFKNSKFVNLRAWRITKMDGENKATAMAPNAGFEKEAPVDNSEEDPPF